MSTTKTAFFLSFIISFNIYKRSATRILIKELINYILVLSDHDNQEDVTQDIRQNCLRASN